MADTSDYIDIVSVGQWLPIPPVGAWVVYDRGVQYGTDYKLSVRTGRVTYTHGSIEDFRYIICQAKAYGTELESVWGPSEAYTAIDLNSGIGEGFRNSTFLTSTVGYVDTNVNNKKTLWWSQDKIDRWNWNNGQTWFIPTIEELKQVQSALSDISIDLCPNKTLVSSTPDSTDSTNKVLGVQSTTGTEVSVNKTDSASWVYCQYLGGTGYIGADTYSTLPSGVTGSFPEGKDTLYFRYIYNQQGTNLFQWGAPDFPDEFFVQEYAEYLMSNANGTALGDGIALGTLHTFLGIANLTLDNIPDTNYLSTCYGLSWTGISKVYTPICQSRLIKSSNRVPLLTSLDFTDFSKNEWISFIPSRDELILVLNNARGKGIFEDGDEFWSGTDTSATEAIAVTYHESSEPTYTSKAKTSLCKALLCSWTYEGVQSVVADPVITVTNE